MFLLVWCFTVDVHAKVHDFIHLSQRLKRNGMKKYNEIAPFLQGMRDIFLGVYDFSTSAAL
jgi:hypothetical protein